MTTEVSIPDCRLAHASSLPCIAGQGADGLMHAALERYIDQVGADVIAILKSGQGMSETLDALIASRAIRGWRRGVYYKTYHARHRLGRTCPGRAMQTFVTGTYVSSAQISRQA